jgi:ABC-2 type transport system permease protein
MRVLLKIDVAALPGQRCACVAKGVADVGAGAWIGALIGLSLHSPEAAVSAGLIRLFPLTFISNAFVPVDTMPGWLQAIAYWNPFSATVQACRTLLGNPGADVAHAWPMQHPVAASALWALLILALFSCLSVRKYRTTRPTDRSKRR